MTEDKESQEFQEHLAQKLRESIKHLDALATHYETRAKELEEHVNAMEKHKS